MVLLRSMISSQWSVVRKASTILALILIAYSSLLITDVRAAEKVYLINIEGMHCKTCVYRVTKSLKKLKEVREVEVDLNDGTATVLLNDGMDLKPEVLEEAVRDSGYNPVSVKELK